jgi:hypothetical protein
VEQTSAEGSFKREHAERLSSSQMERPTSRVHSEKYKSTEKAGVYDVVI